MQPFIRKYHSVITFAAGIAIIAAIAFAFFYPDAPEGNQLRQHDMQQGIAIGQEAKAYAEATGEVTRWTNSLFSGMPTFQISPSYPSSGLYTWINTVMGLGLPSPSSLPAMMMVGFFILLLAMKMRWYVALIGAVAYGFSSYFIIIIGAGHIWKFVTLAYIPPTIAGIILCYRGRYLAGGAMAALFAMMQIASNHVQMTYYFLFVILGIVVACLFDAISKKQLRRWGIATGTLAASALLAVAANAPSLDLTYKYSKETMRGRHSELTSGNPTAQPTSGLDKDYITQYSYQPSETFSLLIPNIKGGASAKAEKGGLVALNLSELPDAKKMADEGKIDGLQQQYLSYMSQYFGDPEGTNGPVYVGVLIFAFFLLGCRIVRGPVKWALLALTIFSIVLAWGRHAMIFTDFMLSVVPMYSKFRTVESILVIAEFTMPLLAAMALQKLLSEQHPWERYRKAVFWSFGITLAICAIGFCCPEIFGSAISNNDRAIDEYITGALMQQGYDAATARQFSLQNPSVYSAVESLRLGMVSSDALRSFLIAGVAFAIITFYMRRKFPLAVAAAAIGALVLADLYTVNKRYLNHDSFVPKQLTVGAPIAKTPADEIILRDSSMNYRVMDIPRFYSADPSYYHKMIGGYHAAKLTRYQDLIDRHLANFTKGEETDADWNVLNMLNARYIVDMTGQVLRNPDALGNAWFVDRIDYVSNPDSEMKALSSINPSMQAVADKKFESVLGASRPKAPGDTIVETSYAPNRLSYRSHSAKGGVGVFSEVFFPWGWTATIDGKEVEIGRVNYILRAIDIPAGDHEIVMTFDPQRLHTADTLATVAIILIYLSVLAALIPAVRRLIVKPDKNSAAR